MLGSSEEYANDLAENWLTSAQEETSIGLERWGVPTSVKPPQQVAAELSRLIACTGATLFAVDQIDPVFAQARTSVADDGSGRTTELVTGRFEPFFEIADFKPPYPTWPVVPESFRDAPGFTPRGLLQRVDEHVRTCLAADEVVPLHRPDPGGADTRAADSGAAAGPPDVARRSAGPAPRGGGGRRRTDARDRGPGDVPAAGRGSAGLDLR
jgi:hypothetical protein